MSAWNYELIGYVASLLVAISLMMRSVIRLRIINLVGAVCFSIYGFLIHSYPVAGMNAFIVAINLYYLAQMMRTRTAFDSAEVANNAEYLQAFLKFYWDDIKSFFPRMKVPSGDQRAYFILRDAMPVGLVITEPRSDQSLFILVDYVIPGYRDFQPGQFFYTEYIPRWQTEGYASLYTLPGPKEHRGYLEKMDFTLAQQVDPELGPLYVRQLQ